MCLKRRKERKEQKMFQKKYDFVDHRLSKLCIRNSVDLSFEIFGKRDVIGPDADNLIRQKISEMLNNNFISIDEQIKESYKKEIQLDALHELQAREREFMRKKFEEEYDNLDAEQEKKFLNSCKPIDIVCFKDKIIYTKLNDLGKVVESIFEELEKSANSQPVPMPVVSTSSFLGDERDIPPAESGDIEHFLNS